jgi:hypothetical protein
VFLEFNNPENNMGPLVDTMKKSSSGKLFLYRDLSKSRRECEIKITVQTIGQYDINHQINVDIK